MRTIRSVMLGLALWSGAAGAAPEVQVKGVKNPETHAYRAVTAGLDKSDELHALAPEVPQLLFQARTRSGKLLDAALLDGGPGGDALGAVLAGDEGYALPLPLDDAGRFHVPRSQPALDADAELRLSKKRSDVRVWPYVRSPGLAGNQRRLGDIRLECQVFVAIAKKEAPLHLVLLANAAMLGSDWCAFMKDADRTWSIAMPDPPAGAVLREGQRSTALRVEGHRVRVPIGDKSWSNDAIVETTPITKASAP